MGVIVFQWEVSFRTYLMLALVLIILKRCCLKMKKINHWILIFLICLIANGLEVSAQVPCKSENLTEYLETIRTEKEVFRLKSAANCIAKLAPSKETAQVLISRLEQTFQETKSLRQDDSAFDQVYICHGA